MTKKERQPKSFASACAKLMAEQIIANQRSLPSSTAKRYQIIEHRGTGSFVVVDKWTQNQRGAYPIKAKAQARARVLNSRQGA